MRSTYLGIFCMTRASIQRGTTRAFHKCMQKKHDLNSATFADEGRISKLALKFACFLLLCTVHRVFEHSPWDDSYVSRVSMQWTPDFACFEYDVGDARNRMEARLARHEIAPKFACVLVLLAEGTDRGKRNEQPAHAATKDCLRSWGTSSGGRD